MLVDIRTRRFTLTPALRDYCERRLRFALGRFSAHLSRVNARLSDINGPRGGDDKRCLLVVFLEGANPVSIERTHRDLYCAIDLAADRIGEAVSRELSRQRRHTRESPMLKAVP
ncbi:MAG TPA: HPF/RaiA family ribosome-associated protein [Myxococcaceae bacterium]|nr:HPF/RaiA family ribosome-associated protein [Myxococcaceae bacterium]